MGSSAGLVPCQELETLWSHPLCSSGSAAAQGDGRGVTGQDAQRDAGPTRHSPAAPTEQSSSGEGDGDRHSPETATPAHRDE